MRCVLLSIDRFPENALLSHDLIEGAYARAGLLSDVELIDDYPSHFSAYSRRKHRWVRGDWQIMRWLLPRVPDFHGNIIPNPMSLISRWKILDNLRRSLLEPATLALLVAGWLFLPGEATYWTLASIAMLLTPVWASSSLFTFAGALCGQCNEGVGAGYGLDISERTCGRTASGCIPAPPIDVVDRRDRPFDTSGVRDQEEIA